MYSEQVHEEKDSGLYFAIMKLTLSALFAAVTFNFDHIL